MGGIASARIASSDGLRLVVRAVLNTDSGITAIKSSSIAQTVFAITAQNVAIGFGQYVRLDVAWLAALARSVLTLWFRALSWQAQYLKLKTATPVQTMIPVLRSKGEYVTELLVAATGGSNGQKNDQPPPVATYAFDSGAEGACKPQRRQPRDC